MRPLGADTSHCSEASCCTDWHAACSVTCSLSRVGLQAEQVHLCSGDQLRVRSAHLPPLAATHWPRAQTLGAWPSSGGRQPAPASRQAACRTCCLGHHSLQRASLRSCTCPTRCPLPDTAQQTGPGRTTSRDWAQTAAASTPRGSTRSGRRSSALQTRSGRARSRRLHSCQPSYQAALVFYQRSYQWLLSLAFLCCRALLRVPFYSPLGLALVCRRWPPCCCACEPCCACPFRLCWGLR